MSLTKGYYCKPTLPFDGLPGPVVRLHQMSAGDRFQYSAGGAVFTVTGNRRTDRGTVYIEIVNKWGDVQWPPEWEQGCVL